MSVKFFNTKDIQNALEKVKEIREERLMCQMMCDNESLPDDPALDCAIYALETLLLQGGKHAVHIHGIERKRQEDGSVSDDD